MFTSIRTCFIAVGLATIIGAVALGSPSAQAVDITGAGATFIYPILSKWSDAYNNATGNKINYQEATATSSIT